MVSNLLCRRLALSDDVDEQLERNERRASHFVSRTEYLLVSDSLHQANKMKDTCLVFASLLHVGYNNSGNMESPKIGPTFPLILPNWSISLKINLIRRAKVVQHLSTTQGILLAR